MGKIKRQVVLVTGATSGIGRACARHLHARGYTVYGTRRPRSKDAPAAFPMVTMDVDVDASVEQGVRQVVEAEGRLDAVVNNAGYSLVGALEDTTVEEARAQLETNFFGVFRVCRAVLPVMRGQHGGCIVNVSSIAGTFGLPFQALYCASKFAVEGMTEALRMEVRPFGIYPVLVEAGNFRTRVTASRRWARAAASGSAYADVFLPALWQFEEDEMAAPAPEEVARLVERILTRPAPRLRYTVGRPVERLAVPLKRWLPYGVFERALLRVLGLR